MQLLNPPLFGVVGWKNSGKTTLLERLIEEFTIRGKTVSAIKHAHHSFDIDHKHRDSYKFRSAGARRTAVVSRNRWAIIHELRQEDEPPLQEIINHIGACDLVLIEGYKGGAFPKIEACAFSENDRALAPDDPNIIAIACCTQGMRNSLPTFYIDDIAAIADFVAEKTGLAS